MTDSPAHLESEGYRTNYSLTLGFHILKLISPNQCHEVLIVIQDAIGCVFQHSGTFNCVLILEENEMEAMNAANNV